MPKDDRDGPLLLLAACLLTGDKEFRPGAVLVREGKVVDAGADVDARDARVVDLPGLTLAPGFIDLHVHGGGGYSLAGDRPNDVRAYALWAPQHGVTGFLAGIVAGTPAGAVPAIRAALAGEPGNGAEMLGLNLEGPFVNPARRGALPATWAAAPNEALLADLLDASAGSLRLMTIAPELTDARALIRSAARAGVKVSTGHTDAGYAEALAGFEAGATHVTHVLNGMRPFHHREPGVVGAALDSPGVTVEVIADGVHLHPSTVRMLLQAFGPERVALITDGVAPAGLEKAAFRLGGQEAQLDGGRVTLPDGTIAGSAATMDTVVANVVRWGTASLAEAVRMASAVPATVAGLGGRKGRIAPGYDADIVALDNDLRVEATWARGWLAHGAPGASL